MNIAKVIKDNTIPSTWKRVKTNEHKYIVSQRSNTNSMVSEIYHCDDCTLNNKNFLFEINGGINKALLSIGDYETRLKNEEKDILNKILG